MGQKQNRKGGTAMCELLKMQITEGISVVKGYLMDDLKFYLKQKVEHMKRKAAEEKKAENQKD